MLVWKIKKLIVISNNSLSELSRILEFWQNLQISESANGLNINKLERKSCMREYFFYNFVNFLVQTIPINDT